MNRSKYIGFIALCLASFNIASAQDVLTKQDAFAITLENNYDIILSQNAVDAAENSKSILNSGYLPTLSNSTTGSYRDFSGQQGNQVNINVSFNYLLFDGMNRKNSFRRLKENYNLSENQAQQVLENTILTLFTAYYEVSRLEENYRSQAQALDISRDRLKRAIYGFDYGQQTRLDVLNAEVDVNNDSINYLDLGRQLANAKRDLNVVMGRDVNTEMVTDTTVLYLENLDFNQLLNSTLNNNTRLKEVQSNIKISGYDLNIAKSTWMPSVSLTSSYTWIENDFNQFFIPLGGTNVGLNLNWNLFDGGRTITNVKNARINIDNQETLKLQLEEQLKRDLSNAWETYQNLLFTYKAQQANVQTNLRNFRRSEEGYKLGQVNSIDFRLAQVNLLTAKLAMSQAKYNAKNAELRLLQLAGVLLDNQVY
jgi:outer membrane protein TolC